MTDPTVPGFPTLQELDADGAIQETAAAVDGDTRAAFLRKAGLAGGALVGGGALAGALPGLASAASLPKSDIAILNFALTLEYLEAAFYKEASSGTALSGNTAAFAKLVAAHEAIHVTTLKSVLGSKPSSHRSSTSRTPRPTRRSSSRPPTRSRTRACTPTSARRRGSRRRRSCRPRARSSPSRPATPPRRHAATPPRRHAAAIALIVDPSAFRDGNPGITPNGPFDKPYSMAKVLRIVGKTGFIVG